MKPLGAPLDPEDRAAFNDAFTRLLGDKSSEADIRKTMETTGGYEPQLWQQLAEIGILGLIVDPEFGGSGASAIELGEVMEAAGAALLCAPLFASSVLAASLLHYSDDSDAQQRLLPGIADGSNIVTVAMTGSKGLWTQDAVNVTANGNSLSGSASYVSYGHIANTLLVVANTSNGIGLFEVGTNAEGLTISPQQAFDLSQRFAKCDFNNTPASPIKGDWSTVEAMLDVGRVALASQQAGGGAHLFDMTIDYIKERYQFGRAVGSFQALKHMSADLLLEKESAISAARHAATSLATGSDDCQEAICLASFACKDSYSKIAFDAIQMHGGIGFTWEYPAHLYVRRARADAQFLGSPAYYRERYIQAMGA